MDLAQPLSSLTPSVDADVLTVLASTHAPLTGRNVSALARRGSPSAVQAILDRLVEHGVVHAQQAGRAVLYTLNREHLLSDAVVSAATARQRLLQRITVSLASWEVPAVHVSVFGSFARGDAGPASDLDVLVVRPESTSDDEAPWDSQLVDLEEQVLSWTGNRLAWFTVDRPGLARAVEDGEPLVASWREDAVHLFGEPLTSLLGTHPSARTR